MEGKVVGYKLLDGDYSLTSEHDRVHYPPDGSWVAVPGNGAYVVLRYGLLVGGGDVVKNNFVAMECEEPTGATVPEGCVCFAKVRRLPLGQDDFVRLSVEAADPYVRCAAVVRVEDQALLARVAVEDVAPYVRRAAVARVEDQVLLARVAVEDVDGRVRRAAVARVEDQVLLARVAVEDVDWYVRSAAVARVEDQALLARVAIEAADRYVRSAAVVRVEELKRTRGVVK